MLVEVVFGVAIRFYDLRSNVPEPIRGTSRPSIAWTFTVSPLREIQKVRYCP